MDYVYAAVFSDGTVKFGRSVDVWKRLYALDAEGCRFDNIMTCCFISTVFDAVKVERDLLIYASDTLTQSSRESFTFGSLDEVSLVFGKARVPYIFCPMSSDQFGPMINANSFSTDFSMATVRSEVGDKSRKGRIKKRVLALIDNYSGAVTRSIFKNRLLNYHDEIVDEVLSEMIADNEIETVAHSLSPSGIRYVRK